MLKREMLHTKKRKKGDRLSRFLSVIAVLAMALAIGAGCLQRFNLDTAYAADGEYSINLDYNGGYPDPDFVEATEAGPLSVNKLSDGTYAFVNDGTGKWTSNNYNINSSTATTTWTLTATTDTTYSIKYKVSSEQGWDKFTLKYDTTTIANAISGTSVQETSYDINVTAGTHTLVATYTKDGSGYRGDDAAYVTLPTPPRSFRYIKSSTTFTDGSEIHVANAKNTDSSKSFIGWKDMETGKCSIDLVLPNSTNKNVNLQAQWGERCTVNYDVNGGKAVTMASKEYVSGLKVDLDEVKASPPDGKAFAGWNIDKNATESLNEFIPEGNSTLYAIYSDIEVGKVYWKLDENLGELHLSAAKGPGYTLIDESSLGSYPTYTPWYINRTKINSVVFDSKVIPTSTEYWLDDCSNLSEIKNIENLDTGEVTEMNAMFYGCSSLTSLDVSGFDTSKVTNMNSMFSDCSSLTSLDVSGFDTSNVTEMKSMFYDCSSLTSLDVSSFDTSKVTGVYNMFRDCSSLTSLDVSGFDTSRVTNMSYMFENCSGLTSLNISGFDTSNVDNMFYMFENCSGLTSLDVSSFDTSKVTYMNSMFNGCSSLTSLDVSGFDTSKVTEMNSMFNYCSGLTSLDVSSFDTSKVTNMNNMFNGCSDLTSLDLSGFDTSNVTGMANMFHDCSELTSLDVSSFDTSKVTDMKAMFYGCSSLTSLDVSGFDTSNTTNMESMFRYCSGLTSLDVSGFDTSKVTGMDYMFSGCSNLTSLDISGFDTSKVTRMDYMFNRCSGLTSLDVSNFDTSKVIYMSAMFADCSPDIFIFSDTLVLKSSPSFPSAEYIHTRSTDGTKLDGSEKLELSTVINDGFTAEEAAKYAGTWVKPGASTVHNNGDGNYEYVTIDDLWVKNGDVWTYTFNVFDDSKQYYAWEEYLQNYTSINMADENGNVDNSLKIDMTTKSGTITNKSDNIGALSLTKTTSGAPAADKNKMYTFFITLEGDKIAGQQIYSDIVFKDGVAQINLKADETKTIEGLPVGTSYKVEEKVTASYTPTYTNAAGIIKKKETAVVTCKNTYQVPKPEKDMGYLTIQKKISGNYETAPADKFKFIINFSNLESNTPYLTSQMGFKADSEGKATVEFELGANESIDFINLPTDAQYQITEAGGKYKSSYKIE